MMRSGEAGIGGNGLAVFLFRFMGPVETGKSCAPVAERLRIIRLELDRAPVFNYRRIEFAKFRECVAEIVADDRQVLERENALVERDRLMQPSAAVARECVGAKGEQRVGENGSERNARTPVRPREGEIGHWMIPKAPAGSRASAARPHPSDKSLW